MDAGQLVKLAPQQAESWYARGVARLGLGREREVIADFEHAEGIRPELVYVTETHAAALASLGDPRADSEIAAAREQRERHSDCAPCLDPFRY